MATEAKRIYLDTNILAYVANAKAPQHKAALQIFRPFDLLHIGIMLAHQVNTIYTFNIKDFSLCSQIEAIDPSHF